MQNLKVFFFFFSCSQFIRKVKPGSKKYKAAFKLYFIPDSEGNFQLSAQI